MSEQMTGKRLPGIGQMRLRDARDAEMWTRLSRFCAEEPGAFDRDPARDHVTASAFVLSPDLTSVLLTHHARLNLWLQLGGHCDGIADAPFVAAKEAYEESGLRRIRQLGQEVFDVDIHQIPPSSREPAHLHYDVRYLFVAEAGTARASVESHALAWVPLADLAGFGVGDSVSVLHRKWPAWRAEVLQ